MEIVLKEYISTFYNLRELMTTEQQLTEQERREADGLLALWQRFNAEEPNPVRLEREIEEMLLACYAKTRETSSEVSEPLRNTVLYMEQMLSAVEKCDKEAKGQLEKNGVIQIGAVPRWFQVKVEELCEQLRNISSRSAGLAPVIDLLMKSLRDCPDMIDGTLCFFKNIVQKLDDLESHWRKTQKSARNLLGQRTKGFSDMRNVVYSALRVWAEPFDARRAYLRDKGVLIAANNLSLQPQQPKPSSKSAQPISLRRRKKNGAKTWPPEKSKTVPPEKPWQVFYVNATTRSVLGSLELLPEDDGTKLVEILNQYCVWPHGGRRTVASLRRLLRMAPNLRSINVASFRIEDANWYRLKFGKYRMLVWPKDDEHTVFLMAEHRTKLYGDIGRSKNES
ncbi:MAG: hypothetical protein NT026_00635 [Candidatus Staskawiczbacteria bacterium]|nr:hypothetical protein [Candidatus Staskawiczbacteria bacterium]